MLTLFGEVMTAAVCLAGGIWLGIVKGNQILAWYKGAEKYAQELKAQATALEAKAAAVKNAAKS